MPNNIQPLNNFHNDIKTLLQNARNKVYASINSTMTQTYWKTGKRIVEEEQGGESRAKYGKELLKNLSIDLSQEFGKGFSVDNLENMRKFYLAYPKSETVSRKFKLSWLHYIFLTRMSDEDEGYFYEAEATEGAWTMRELKRQISVK